MSLERLPQLVTSADVAPGIKTPPEISLLHRLVPQQGIGGYGDVFVDDTIMGSYIAILIVFSETDQVAMRGSVSRDCLPLPTLARRRCSFRHGGCFHDHSAPYGEFSLLRLRVIGVTS